MFIVCLWNFVSNNLLKLLLEIESLPTVKCVLLSIIPHAGDMAVGKIEVLTLMDNTFQ